MTKASAVLADTVHKWSEPGTWVVASPLASVVLMVLPSLNCSWGDLSWRTGLSCSMNCYRNKHPSNPIELSNLKFIQN